MEFKKLESVIMQQAKVMLIKHTEKKSVVSFLIDAEITFKADSFIKFWDTGLLEE